jgi:flagellar biosynthesis/type III secretory pathway ATPase
MSVPADTLPPMNNTNAAQWAMSAANKFREVDRTTENPTTKLLAEGLTHLAEAIRELDAK